MSHASEPKRRPVPVCCMAAVQLPDPNTAVCVVEIAWAAIGGTKVAVTLVLAEQPMVVVVVTVTE